ncbi:MAG TPA: hypothetical protein VHE12_10910 [bacterium]|nr:hypothetical protein [bacterium]
MVKKILFPIGLLVLGGLLVLTGCNQANPPVTPRDSASLVIAFPVPKTVSPALKNRSRSGVPSPKSALPLSYGTFEYNISAGSEAVTGFVDISYGVTMGTVSIPLPHNGTWLVSAEWLEYGNPRFIGADQAVVNGTTNLNLQMGDVTLYGCSYDYLADPNSCYSTYSGDIFTFDSGFIGYSTNLDTGDIQIVYDQNNGTETMTSPSGASHGFAYLGTGDWLNYTQIPSGTVYYADSEAAKTAILGAGNGGMAYGDVYAIQISPTSHVWLQITGDYNCGSGDEVYFGFRVNTQGYSYMKYEATSYGKANCTNETYSGGGGG